MRKCCDEGSVVAEDGPSNSSENDNRSGMLLVTVGNPNTGKTTLVNALSGAQLRIGNWPGTTVERMEVRFNVAGQDVFLVDLPGAYGLSASTAEERLTRDELLHQVPRTVINVVDSGNLERNLAFTIELTELGYPLVLAFNLLDEAQAKGLSPNAETLQKALGVEVVPTVAVREEGTSVLVEKALEAKPSPLVVHYHQAIEEAVADIAHKINHPGRRWLALAGLMGEHLEAIKDQDELIGQWCERLENLDIDLFLEISDARYRLARQMATQAQPVKAGIHRLTQVLDHWALHRWFGLPMFLLVMLLVFRFTFVFSNPWVAWLGQVKDVLVHWATSVGMPPILHSFIVSGLLEGVGTVLAFTPVLFVLYFALSFLESSGFLARSSFLIDRLMKCMGLPGKAFIPLLVGFGCNVPGIAATKTLESASERLRVAMAVPFVSCSARMAVLSFFASLFFPKLAALVLLAMYGLGLVLGLVAILLLSRVMPKDECGSVMELPPYRIPTLRVLWRQASARTMSFLEGAGGAILVAVIIVWALLNFPSGAPEDSAFGIMSGWLTWLAAPMGISDWRLVGALVPGFVAKEVVLGTLAVSFMGTETIEPLGALAGLQIIVVGFFEALRDTVYGIPGLVGLPSFGGAQGAPVGLSAHLSKQLTQSSALAYMVFVLLYTPCIATLAALKVEFGAKWAWASAGWHLVVAWIFALLVSFLPL